jgi:acyl-CoA reductase-like NAD-dependent aldehyde dehydrogenase
LPSAIPPPGRSSLRYPPAIAEDVDRAVAAARRKFDEGEWPRRTPGARAKVLNRLADLIEDRMEQFSELEATNNGRPIHETRAQLTHWRSHCVAKRSPSTTDISPTCNASRSA